MTRDDDARPRRAAIAPPCDNLPQTRRRQADTIAAGDVLGIFHELWAGNWQSVGVALVVPLVIVVVLVQQIVAARRSSSPRRTSRESDGRRGR